MKKIPWQKQQDVKRRLKAGETTQTITDATGVSRASIGRIRSLMGTEAKLETNALASSVGGDDVSGRTTMKSGDAPFQSVACGDSVVFIFRRNASIEDVVSGVMAAWRAARGA